MLRKYALPSLALLALVSCEMGQQPVLSPDAELPPVQPEVFDGQFFSSNDGANEHFFFEPPLVKKPMPNGDFDPGVNVLVEFCKWDADDNYCTEANLAEYTRTSGFNGEPVQVSETDQVYQVNLHTDQFNIEYQGEGQPSYVYAVVVSAIGTVASDPFPLGYAEVQFGANGKEVKEINSGNEYVGLVDGRTLPAKFRIEYGAVDFAQQEAFDCNPGADNNLIDCDVEEFVAADIPSGACVNDADLDNTVTQCPSLEVYDGSGTDLVGVLTFLDSSIPTDGAVAVFRHVASPPSPELDDTKEIGPFLEADLYNADGTKIPVPGDGVRLAICQDIDPADPDKLSIYKVDVPANADYPAETRLLKTAYNPPECEESTIGHNGSSAQDGSLLGVLRQSLGQVASLFLPEPLRALHGGLNTEEGMNDMSFFGSVEVNDIDYDVPAAGTAGYATDIAVALGHNQPGDPFVKLGEPTPTDPSNPYVGSKCPGDECIVTVEITSGPNAPRALPVTYSPSDGVYRASYTPQYDGADNVRITVNLGFDKVMDFTSTVVPPDPEIFGYGATFDYTVNNNDGSPSGISPGSGPTPFYTSGYPYCGLDVSTGTGTVDGFDWLNKTLTLTKQFLLGPIVTNVRIYASIDNDVRVILNGTDITENVFFKGTAGSWAYLVDGAGTWLKHEDCADPAQPAGFEAIWSGGTNPIDPNRPDPVSNATIYTDGSPNTLTIIARDRGVIGYVNVRAEAVF